MEDVSEPLGLSTPTWAVNVLRFNETGLVLAPQLNFYARILYKQNQKVRSLHEENAVII